MVYVLCQKHIVTVTGIFRIMYLDKELGKYTVYVESPIIEALSKGARHKQRVLFCVTEHHHLVGVLSNGDFQRWLLQQEDIDLSAPVSSVCNTNFVQASINEKSVRIEYLFEDHIDTIPLVDDYGHLVAVAVNKPSVVKVGSFTISDSSPAFIIAEIGNNHNGDIKLAKQLVDKAVWAGADCVKFQLRNMDELYSNKWSTDNASEDLGAQYVMDLLSKFQLTKDEMFELFDYCQTLGILPLCTPWDVSSVRDLDIYGMVGFKVASADLTNPDLLHAIAKTGKPVILSTGMSTENEIRSSVAFLKELSVSYVLLHCNSTYPAPYKDINLRYMERLKEIGDCQIGYSGHERGYHIALAAVSRGAKVIEKHFTLDRNMEGNDHKVSLLPEEFKNMVEEIRQIEESLGSKSFRELTQGEMMNRETLAKSITAKRDIAEGETITHDMLDVKSPGKGLQPNRRNELVGRIIHRNVKAGDFFYLSDIKKDTVIPRSYKFKRLWGVPVRYHDFLEVIKYTNPGLLEFHLSYKDLDLDFNDYIKSNLDMDLVVHSPELFAEDHILDLCSKDESYRRRSVQNLQRVIELTQELKSKFNNVSGRILIVTNVGGFSVDGFITDKRDLDNLTKQLSKSLSELECSGVEIIPQTMPPFPWHFGGQRYHNLFVDPVWIKQFCDDNAMRICFDVSHSQLACNYYHWSLSEFLDKIGPHIAHLHIADALNSDGEGLQIGEGNIVFSALARQLDVVAKNASFIPEIWQGHKNGGEGFWTALEKLEAWF